MTDITDLFARTAADADATPDGDTVEADLARGRLALRREHRRRTVRRSMAATSTVAAAAVVAVIVAQTTGSSPHDPAGEHADRPPSTIQGPVKPKAHPIHRIKLVAYHGKQLNGFTVDEVPAGWHLSTSTQYALLITKDGSTDNDPDAFEGKLAVLTSSIDQHGLGKGELVSVNGQPGKVSVQGNVQLLNYNSTNGFGINIQAPTELHWTDAQIVDFAEGVHVTSNAVHSEG